MPEEADYIGPDPVIWVDRLLEVNRGSQFSGEQKETIRTGLLQLRERLVADTPLTLEK